MKQFLRHCIIFAFMLVIAPSFAEEGVSKPLAITMGKAQTVDLSQPISEVLVSNPNIVDVGMLTKKRLYVVGRSVGDTNVLIFDQNNNTLASLDVNVSNDQFTLQRVLKQYFPDESVTARTVNKEVILTGRVSNPLKAGQIRDLAKRFVTGSGAEAAASAGGSSTAPSGPTIVDLMTVEGEQQVMLQVKIVEAKRNVLKEYGLEPSIGGTGAIGNFRGTLASSTAAQLTSTPFSVGSLIYETQSRGPISLTMRALEEKGLLNTLAEPNLTAISGQRAEFLAGGEYPVPVGQNNGEISIDFKPFGVSLGFTPVVLSNDKIQLELETEVSLLSNEARIQLQTVNIPSLTVRRAKTTVEMSSGGSLMMAGLIQSDAVNTMDSLPGINKIPIIGKLFSSQDFQRNESELLIMVTPYLVHPIKKPAGEMVSDDNLQGIQPVNSDSLPPLPLNADAAKMADTAPAQSKKDAVVNAPANRLNPTRSVGKVKTGYLME
jgi:pilus assembly protein CpaC